MPLSWAHCRPKFEFWVISYNLYQIMACKRNCLKILKKQLNQQAGMKQTVNILNLKIKKQPKRADYKRESHKLIEMNK